jgi:hypothetical protein
LNLTKESPLAAANEQPIPRITATIDNFWNKTLPPLEWVRSQILADLWSPARWCAPSTIDSGIRAAASSRFDATIEPTAICAERTAALERTDGFGGRDGEVLPELGLSHLAFSASDIATTEAASASPPGITSSITA